MAWVPSVVRSRLPLFRLLHGFFLAVLGTTLFLSSPVSAEVASPSSDQLVQLLEKVQAAAREVDYEGVFTYQQGSRLKSSRLIHVVDGTGERERLEVLDGSPREFLRHNDQVQCLVPDRRLIVVQERRTDRFPGFLSAIPEAALSRYYSLEPQDESARVAGRQCRLVDIRPTDDYRYGYRLCIDEQTHLLLKAQTLDADSNIVDQIAFSSLLMGKDVAVEQLESGFDTRNWKVLNTVPAPADAAAEGWRVAVPPGFSISTQIRRPLKSGEQAIQLVLDDGLVAISVFLEPVQAAGRHGAHFRQPALDGVTAVYRDRIADYWVTAIGEVPVSTVRYLVEHTEYVPAAHPVQ